MRMLTIFAFTAAMVASSALAMPMDHIAASGRHHHQHHDHSVVVQGNKIELPPMRVARHGAMANKNEQQGLVADTAAATVLLHESLFTKLVASVLPAVVAEAKTLVIPAVSEAHFSVGPISLASFGIGSFSITFAAPNKVVVSLDNLVLSVAPTDFAIVDVKILNFNATCAGNFSVQVGAAANKTATGVQVEFDMTETADGFLNLTDGVASVKFGDLVIDHNLYSKACQMGQDLIEKFVGNIDTLIRNLVEKEATPIATKAINAVFAKMAAKLHVPLAAQPVATADSIELSFSLLPPPAAQARSSLHHRRNRHAAVTSSSATAVSPVVAAFPSRDIELFVTQQSVNSLLGYLQQNGTLNIVHVLPLNTSVFDSLLPAAYNACPDCPIQVTTNFQIAPSAALAGGDASLGVRDLIVGIAGVAPNGTVVQLFDINLNGTLETSDWAITGTEGNTVRFSIAIPVFTMTLWQSSIGPIDMSLIDSLLSYALKYVVVPDFNKKFKGIAIPPIANVTVEQFEIAFNNSVDIGANIVIPAL